MLLEAIFDLANKRIRINNLSTLLLCSVLDKKSSIELNTLYKLITKYDMLVTKISDIQLMIDLVVDENDTVKLCNIFSHFTHVRNRLNDFELEQR